jgi:hypothetical protein
MCRGREFKHLNEPPGGFFQAISMALLVAALGMPDNPDVAHILSVGGTLLYDFTPASTFSGSCVGDLIHVLK